MTTMMHCAPSRRLDLDLCDCDFIWDLNLGPGADLDRGP